METVEQAGITQLWDLCLEFEYDRGALVDGLAAWLGPPDERRILDCACGTGFPALDLIERGYRIECSDGSADMLDRLRVNARRRGLTVEARQEFWDRLPLAHGPEFDVVMCRGSSLIYAGGWDSDAEVTAERIAAALRGFRQILRPSGVLYVDTTSARSLEENSEDNVYPPRAIDGTIVSLRERIITLRAARRRIWAATYAIDGRPYSFLRHSYWMPHEELRAHLHAAGFTAIEQPEIAGEHYAVFTARAG